MIWEDEAESDTEDDVDNVPESVGNENFVKETGLDMTQSTVVDDGTPTLGRSSRLRKPPVPKCSRICCAVALSSCNSTEEKVNLDWVEPIVEPVTAAEALNGKYSSEWSKALDVEMNQMRDLMVWDVR